MMLRRKQKYKKKIARKKKKRRIERFIHKINSSLNLVILVLVSDNVLYKGNQTKEVIMCIMYSKSCCSEKNFLEFTITVSYPIPLCYAFNVSVHMPFLLFNFISTLHSKYKKERMKELDKYKLATNCKLLTSISSF